MRWRSIAWTVLGTITLAASACDLPFSQKPVDEQADDQAAEEVVVPAKVDIGQPLYQPRAPRHPSVDSPSAQPGRQAIDPIVISECRLTATEKEEVPAQRDGVIRFIGTEIKAGEVVPPDQLITIDAGNGQVRQFKRLREGDFVAAHQLMAMLDDRLARDDLASKQAKIREAEAELIAAEKAKKEALERSRTQERLTRTGVGKVTSEEERRGAQFVYEKAIQDENSKREGVNVAKMDAEAAKTVVEMHEIRSSIPGIIMTIYKQPGEAVKNLEPVFLIRNLTNLRAEGLVDVQNYSRLHKGMKAIVEPTQALGPQQTLVGHFQEVTGVAVSKDNRPVSCSTDGTIRVWDRPARHEQLILKPQIPTPVRAIACTPYASKHNWCLSGSADGVGRLWELDTKSDAPLRLLKDHHQGAITCVGFSPDGKLCATGGEDHSICLWNSETGAFQYQLSAVKGASAHRGAVTSVQFTPLSQLLSAGQDNTVRLWTLGQKGAKLEQSWSHRSGDVANLGVSPDGTEVLLDQGKALRLLSLPQGLTQGVIQNPSGAANFTSFALFSPDGRLILTTGSAEGRMQLWRAPSGANHRSYEVRQLIPNDRSAGMTCAAFSPDGSTLVTGSRDRQVVLWAVPSQADIEREMDAVITLVEPAVDSSAGQVRVWAVLGNQNGELLPGNTVTLSIWGN